MFLCTIVDLYAVANCLAITLWSLFINLYCSNFHVHLCSFANILVIYNCTFVNCLTHLSFSRNTLVTVTDLYGLHQQITKRKPVNVLYFENRYSVSDFVHMILAFLR